MKNRYSISRLKVDCVLHVLNSGFICRVTLSNKVTASIRSRPSKANLSSVSVNSRQSRADWARAITHAGLPTSQDPPRELLIHQAKQTDLDIYIL